MCSISPCAAGMPAFVGNIRLVFPGSWCLNNPGAVQVHTEGSSSEEDEAFDMRATGYWNTVCLPLQCKFSLPSEAEQQAKSHVAPPVSVVPAEPLLPPNEYRIFIDKDDDVGAGMVIESIGDMLIVVKIRSGPVQRWNKAHYTESDLLVRVGDAIVSVNGTEGSSDALLEELQRSNRLVIVMRHSREFQVDIDRTSKDFGICVLMGSEKHDMLKVVARNEGDVDDWNEEHPDREVRVGDRIFAVNGIVCEPPKMMAQLRSSKRLQISFIRPA